MAYQINTDRLAGLIMMAASSLLTASLIVSILR